MATPVFTVLGPATLTAEDAITLEVISTPALALTVLALEYPGIPTVELVWDGAAFTGPYAATSTRTVIANGFRFTVRRAPAWPDTPVLVGSAANTAGEVGTVSYAWPPLLPAPAGDTTTLVPFASAGAPDLSGSGASLRDYDWFLALYDRIFPADYLRAMKEGEGPGYELFQAFARTAARVSLAVRRFEDGATLLFSEGPAFSTGTVEFFRQNYGAGAVTVLSGSLVADAQGRPFYTTADAVFGATALGPVTAPILAAVPSYQWDVPGEMLAPSGQAVPGTITRILRLLESPDFGDPSVQVRNIAPTTGGRDGQLDLNAMDRGIFRAPGEVDDSVRFRARALPDVVSPAAIRRLVASYLEAYGAGWEYIETALPAYQTFYDAEDGGLGYDPDLFFYDDFQDDPPFRNRWLDEVENSRCFLIAMDEIEPVEETGGVYDDEALNLDNLVSDHHLGGRAVSAFDFADGEADYLTMAYDGEDAALVAVYAGLWNAIQRARPAGITVGFVLRERGS